MPKDPKRNIQNYQLEGGHLNEFEFQKRQGEMAEEKLPFTDETDKPNLARAKRFAKVAAEAHQKVETRRKRAVAKTGGRQSIAAGKGSANKAARKSPKKTTTRAGVKKRASVKRKKSKTGR